MKIKVRENESIGVHYLRLVHKIKIIDLIETFRTYLTIQDNQPLVIGIKEEGYRVLLALLINHPHHITQQDIATITKLHSGSISRTLGGKRGDFSKFIEEYHKTYKLNETGFQWVKEKLLLELSKEV